VQLERVVYLHIHLRASLLPRPVFSVSISRLHLSSQSPVSISPSLRLSISPFLYQHLHVSTPVACLYASIFAVVSLLCSLRCGLLSLRRGLLWVSLCRRCGLFAVPLRCALAVLSSLCSRCALFALISLCPLRCCLFAVVSSLLSLRSSPWSRRAFF
jgi:hypothetical protein